MRFPTTTQYDPTSTNHAEEPRPGTNHPGDSKRSRSTETDTISTWGGSDHKQQEHQPTARNDKDRNYNSGDESSPATTATNNPPSSPQRPHTSPTNPHDNATAALDYPDHSGADPTEPSDLEKNDESSGTENKAPIPMTLSLIHI